jgi:hypothetical protein
MTDHFWPPRPSDRIRHGWRCTRRAAVVETIRPDLDGTPRVVMCCLVQRHRPRRTDPRRGRTEDGDMTWASIKDALLHPADFIRWWRSERREWSPTPCAECGIELLPDTPPNVRDWHRHMVHDHVWAEAGMDPLGGWLCIRCLERRLRRPLTGADFPDLPLNDLDSDKDTPRLARLKRAAAHGRRPT